MSVVAALSRTRTRTADMVLAVLVVAIVGMMVVPLPTPVIDALIAINLTLAVLLLATALYMRDALSFAAFPTLILIATLYRLALNVSSTRLILLQADAGRIIEAFGSVVVRGDYAVGALVFVVITLIQFLVIARGAERVAEVGARFSLDAMPGKQMAIDAELRAGTLGSDAARSARKRLERESQLYGAMDGAMKFVKGDAIAGIVITMINFIGGVTLGATSRGLDVTSSLKTYGLLTIGDGLVTQIPSLLGSTAAALAVTRVASDRSDGSLGSDIGEQLFGDARVLIVATLVLAGLAIVPGIPSWPFVLMAALCAWLAFRARSRHDGSSRTADDTQANSKVALQLGSELAREWLSRGKPNDALAQALERARSRVLQRFGFTLPSITVHEDAALSARSYRLSFRGLPDPARDQAGIAGPAALDALVLDLLRSARSHVDVCLSVSDVQHMLDRLESEEPLLVRKLPSRGITPHALTQLLRRLLREGVGIHYLGEILEALDADASVGTQPNDPATVMARVRLALSRRINHQIAPEGNLHVLRLDPLLEETLLDALTQEGHERWLALPPDLAHEIESAIVEAVRATPEPHALVTTASLRQHVQGMLAQPLPELYVLSAAELSANLTLISSRVVSP